MSTMSSGKIGKLSHAIPRILVTGTENFCGAILATWSQTPFHFIVIKFEFALLHAHFGSENNIIIVAQDQNKLLASQNFGLWLN